MGLSRSLRPGRLDWVTVLQSVNSVVSLYLILRRREKKQSLMNSSMVYAKALKANVYADHQIIAERYGYRKVMMCALVYMSCIFFLHFFAQSLPMLLVAQILVGVPWGSESIHE
jgi:hypothetical protein